jgi:tRNA(Ile)-lysidine synthase TilS/MesJ
LNHYVPFFHDPTNEDTSKGRNQVRHNIIPEVLKLNPGIKKQLVRRMIEKYQKAKK